MEIEGRELPGSCEEREREGCLPAGSRGAWLSGCESLQSLDSAAENRGGDKSRGSEEQIVDSRREPIGIFRTTAVVYILYIRY